MLRAKNQIDQGSLWFLKIVGCSTELGKAGKRVEKMKIAKTFMVLVFLLGISSLVHAQYYDDETGFHQNGHRDYDPSTGRYLEPDPIGLAGGINYYAYVQNNPVNFIDPLGLAPHDGFIRQLARMANKSLSRTIKSLIKNIENHERAIADECQKLSKKHHEHELRLFKEQLRLAEQEAARRGLFSAGFAEAISDEEVEERTSGWFDYVDPFLFPGVAF